MEASINGIRMNYAVEGLETGIPVVLHHPLATNMTIWDELTAALTPRYRVLRFDARGHGKTDAPVGPYVFETLAADVVALMDHVKIERAHFLGLSMGGMAGQYLGLGHAKRFKSLQLVATSSRVPAEARHLWSDRVKVVREKGMASQPPTSMQRWLTEANRQKPALVARLSQMIETTPAEGYIGWCQAIREFNVTSRLAGIKLPVRIIAGGIDPATTPAMMQVIHREIPGSEYAEVPGTAHMLHVEEPAKFHAEVLPFMAKHGPKG